jgi:hypothetical protein
MALGTSRVASTHRALDTDRALVLYSVDTALYDALG